MSGDTGTNTVQTQNSDPWAGQAPYLATGFARAQDWLNAGGAPYFPWSTVPQQSAVTQQTQQMALNKADTGNPAMNAVGGVAQTMLTNGLGGSDYLRSAAGGDYLTQNNPFFQQRVDNAIMAARPSVDAAFASTGRLGSGAHANAFADAATRTAADIGYQDYARERQLQQGAAGLLNQSDYNAASLGANLAGQSNAYEWANLGQRGLVGDAMDQRLAAQLGDAMNRWNYNANAPYNTLQQFMNVVGNRSYGQNTTMTSPGANPWMQGIGAGIGLLGAGSQFYNLGQNAGWWGGASSMAGATPEVSWLDGVTSLGSSAL